MSSRSALNVPAFIERTAKLRRAVNDVVASKSFDNGMICASEQAVILDEPIYEAAMAEFATLHAYRCNPTEKAALERLIFGAEAADGVACSGAKLNPAVVGQSPVWIAEQAGFTVPEETSIILVEVPSVGRHEPLTREKLCPVLAVLRAEDAEAGIDVGPCRVFRVQGWTGRSPVPVVLATGLPWCRGPMKEPDGRT